MEIRVTWFDNHSPCDCHQMAHPYQGNHINWNVVEGIIWLVLRAFINVITFNPNNRGSRYYPILQITQLNFIKDKKLAPNLTAWNKKSSRFYPILSVSNNTTLKEKCLSPWQLHIKLMEKLERCLSFHHQNWQSDMWNVLLLFLSKWELHISKTGTASVWVKWLAKRRALQVTEVGVRLGAAWCVNGELFSLFGAPLINLESGDNKRAYFSGLLWGFTEMKHGDCLAPCLVYNKLLLKVTHYFSLSREMWRM